MGRRKERRGGTKEKGNEGGSNEKERERDEEKEKVEEMVIRKAGRGGAMKKGS